MISHWFRSFEVDLVNVGYGYEISTITVRLSLIVITCYLAMVTSYLVCTMITGDIANGWNTVVELSTTLVLDTNRPKKSQEHQC
jgi:cell division protein FtsX